MTKTAKQKLILVDGSSYLFRAYHTMQNPRLTYMTNSAKEPTGAIYGVINMLKRMQRDFPNDPIVVVFDAKGKTFRNDMYPEYKANRPPMQDDLRVQIEPIHNIVKAMGFPLLCVSGVEADDVIGTLARQASELKIETIISTGDKDMAQLVDDHVSLINTMTETSMDRQGVIDKFGVPPESIIDYLTLIGDTVDNVPGVPKVGPKTAVKWLAEYKTLENIIANADAFKGKVGEYLRETLPQLPLSKELVTIKCDVELDQTPDQIKMNEVDIETLRENYSHFEFRSWLKQLSAQVEAGEQGGTAPVPAELKKEYQTIFEFSELDIWLARLKKADVFAFDLETTSLNYMQAEIVGLSFSDESGKAAYVPVAHEYDGVPTQLDRDQVLARFKSLLEDPAQLKVGQNLKYDMSVLANYDIHLQGIAFDTMLESYVLDSTGSRHDMDTLALKYLDHQTIHYEDVAGKGAKQIGFEQVTIEVAGEYAAEDADITLQLHETLWPQLQQHESLVKVFQEIELPLVPVLSRMERIGVLIDKAKLLKQSEQISERLVELEKQAYEEAGEEFNLGSPKQIQAILFEKLGLPIISKTPKGQPSTAESVLQELAEDYALPKLILETRGLSKLKSTYTDKLPEMIDANTGRVHTSYHQAVAATGRLSSTEPNLQNIPIRSEEGRRIRKAFIAEAGYKVVAADYSQIELRIMAHLSGDEGLLKAFAAGEDIHRATAAEVFAHDNEEVTSEQRRSAKAINFGLIYGMSAFGLAKQLGVGRHEAQSYIDLYFSRYPGVKDYMDQTREQAREQGYVETVFGRRLYLHEINATNAMRRQYAERTAINAPMQGTAADIIKFAMINLDKIIYQQTLDIKMIMQVHDELVFEIKDDILDSSINMIREQMVKAASLSVPLIVDIGVGNDWDQAH
ncbi:DNA polymerase I [hydrothermal vent metagenome]|uniref:DNA-directed DNA polymerase n=1 Tax=hydrothermal vent metagenome TaxID=652676 RepID=A0A3B0ZR72_9ZZZZ